MEISKELMKKLSELINFLKQKKVIVAFSGGIDSSLLAYLSGKHAAETLLVTINSEFMKKSEIKIASNFARKYDIAHKIIEISILENQNVQKNPQNRCYYCKKFIYSKLKDIRRKLQFDIILDGSNLDDLSDYRPGNRAIKELKITTPFLDFNLNKEDIRTLSKHFNFENYDVPSSACLASRIPYGESIKKENLDKVEKGEEFLKTNFDLHQLRVRVHYNDLARIELLEDDLVKIITKSKLKKIEHYFKKIGFRYITLDIEGYRMGSMNEILDKKSSSNL
ncbi:MAG: ATP-dependent sacrificial sulfur transferase LarE [Candidatus Lokiarchaeota archaeon]|nr:ATP-dependent sacrificial sulfur transferase LarE [Candidatus Lokiarchaeota archaeon]MBD3201648.1 ATP-dependent sacrificial sulfur transferase LarE [Candidatus Lokiarchaeota archaeon]